MRRVAVHDAEYKFRDCMVRCNCNSNYLVLLAVGTDAVGMYGMCRKGMMLLWIMWSSGGRCGRSVSHYGL